MKKLNYEYMAEKKYTIKEIIGFASAACAVLGIGVQVAPKNEQPTQYIEAQAVRDSIKTEEIKALKTQVNAIGRKLDSSYQDLRSQNDSVKWAVKNLVMSIETQNKLMRISGICENEGHRVARRN